MGQLQHIITPLHTKTKRDYLSRMSDDKAACMKVAKAYGQDYWDGDRRYGYGGYHYDGRWEPVARALISGYRLSPRSKVLYVGCGKGYLLYELQKLLPGLTVKGFDISSYAIEHAKPEIKACLWRQGAEEPYVFADREFDLVLSINTLHNLPAHHLRFALKEIERVGKKKYITMESFRSDQELFNLQCWALTCASFFSPEEWVWFFEQSGYSGDFEFIYFE